ncbi:hypothetical protein COEREDRAFT_82446 [Coemansia reversa NRRL 1564]|uniref:Myb-like domain-containing protein n=1 Tax=Coemansia reversa (strain ATCC 12441 / NRRL 1564) TaxID=763665 RepID=A0A2G5B736_COERN|nr:hypothetical protein COEREDRAFT_82446 [Coemansia reversa NRRL 1564]|eukprot:PIA14836.1 hypothetical protein COEREDRAFT_82446 [Coemansia reversa NRRL 1564]
MRRIFQQKILGVILQQQRHEHNGITKKPTFLQPQLDPHRGWNSITSTVKHEKSTYPLPRKREENLWTLSERRALFYYVRAIRSKIKRDPDWTFISSRLERDANECRFIYTSMRRKWEEYIIENKDAKTSTLTIQQLLNPNTIDTDDETINWVLRLCDPPEPLLNKSQSITRKRWTEEDEKLLINTCPLYRRPSKNELEDFVNITGRSIIGAYHRLLGLLQKNKHVKASPLTENEIMKISQAAKKRYPHPVQWEDVCDELPGRTFYEVINQTYPLQTQRKLNGLVQNKLNKDLKQE